MPHFQYGPCFSFFFISIFEPLQVAYFYGLKLQLLAACKNIMIILNRQIGVFKYACRKAIRLV